MKEIVFEADDWYVERHALPNGREVFYKDGDGLPPQAAHSYWAEYKGEGKCGKRIPGISTISKCDGQTSNDGLLDWAARLTCEGVAREAALGLAVDPEEAQDVLSWLASGESIQETLKDSKLTWRDLRSQKGDIGSASHGILENLAAGLDVLPANGYDRAVVEWWKQTQPEPIYTESVVYSAEHGFAGRFDLFFRRRAEEGVLFSEPRRSLLDLKTSNWVGPSFAIQLNLYRLGALECGLFEEVDELIVLHVKPDGTFDEIEVPIRPDWALTALRSYVHGKELGDWARSTYKRKAAA